MLAHVATTTLPPFIIPPTPKHSPSIISPRVYQIYLFIRLSTCIYPYTHISSFYPSIHLFGPSIRSMKSFSIHPLSRAYSLAHPSIHPPIPSFTYLSVHTSIRPRYLTPHFNPAAPKAIATASASAQTHIHTNKNSRQTQQQQRDKEKEPAKGKKRHYTTERETKQKKKVFRIPVNSS